jgi:hypothetical protein
MASNRELEQFILEFGLEISSDGNGRPTSLPALLKSAQNKLGNIDSRQLQDAIYTMNPLHSESSRLEEFHQWRLQRPGSSRRPEYLDQL